jgi:hypothetical protein
MTLIQWDVDFNLSLSDTKRLTKLKLNHFKNLYLEKNV